MILFIIYLSLFLVVIYRKLIGSLFDDEGVSAKELTVVFLLKALAVPVFFYLFKIMYGGIDRLDAGKFFHDSVVMNHLAYSEPGEFLKMIFGLQDDRPGSVFFRAAIEPTFNWDNGQLKDFFYNDNRIVIRIHSLINFFAFDSYFVHALFACFFSFAGSVLIYKSVKEYFKIKSVWVLAVICFFPTLWLYTGAVLKEPYVIFFLGCNLYTLKKLIRSYEPKWLILMVALLVVSLLLKPYILFYSLICFGIFHVLMRFYHRRGKVAAFITLVFLLAITLNAGASFLRDKTFAQAALERKKEFADMSHGGIFLMDSVKFIRMKCDYRLVRQEGPLTDSCFRVKKGVSFYYWEHSHQKDTLYCASNSDTVTRYKLVYDIPEAGSNFEIGTGNNNLFVLAAKGFYFATLYPFFFNAKGVLQLVSSAENLLIAMAFIIFLFGIAVRFKKKQDDLLFPIVSFFFAVTLLIIIGITTPNAGALMRYRSPVVIFLLLAALNIFPPLRKKERVEASGA